jgi:hypothetical protein
MNIALWIVQSLLAAVFVVQGAIKFSPPPNLPLMLHWVVDLHNSSPGLSAFIGVSELLGAVGLILPSDQVAASAHTPRRIRPGDRHELSRRVPSSAGRDRQHRHQRDSICADIVRDVRTCTSRGSDARVAWTWETAQ